MKKSLLALACAVATVAPLAFANAQTVEPLSLVAANPTVLDLGEIGSADPSGNTSAAIGFGKASVVDYYFELQSPATVSTSLLGSDSTYYPDSSYVSLVGGSALPGTSLNAVQFGAPQSTSFNLSPGTEYELVVTGTPGTYFTANVSAAPEPATWALMVLGIGAIGVAMRRSRRMARGALVAA
jgi:hypothetical protein